MFVLLGIAADDKILSEKKIFTLDFISKQADDRKCFCNAVCEVNICV